MHTTEIQRSTNGSSQEQSHKAAAGLAVWAIAVITAAIANTYTQPFFDVVISDGGVAFCVAMVCDAFVALMVIAALHSVGSKLEPYLFRKLW